jgi:hypothetical protein
MRKLVELDPGGHVGVVGMVTHDVIEDLVVVVEPQVAVRALVGRVFHASIFRPVMGCG